MAITSNRQPLADFFTSFPDFDYDPSAPAYEEWWALSDSQGWPSKRNVENHQERDLAYRRFRIAAVKAFNTVFGSDPEDVKSWTRLCTAIGIHDAPDSLSGKRNAVLRVHVNLWDVLAAAQGGKPATRFSSLEKLRENCMQPGRIFPREDAYADDLLKYLLREIVGTYHGHRKPGMKPEKGRRKKSLSDGQIKSVEQAVQTEEKTDLHESEAYEESLEAQQPPKVKPNLQFLQERVAERLSKLELHSLMAQNIQSLREALIQQQEAVAQQLLQLHLSTGQVASWPTSGNQLDGSPQDHMSACTPYMPIQAEYPAQRTMQEAFGHDSIYSAGSSYMIGPSLATVTAESIGAAQSLAHATVEGSSFEAIREAEKKSASRRKRKPSKKQQGAIGLSPKKGSGKKN